MDGLVLIIVLVLSSAIMAGIDLVEAHRRGAPRRALERTKPTEIALLQQGGLTKIAGVVAPREAMLTSAVGRQPCIGYSSAVDVASIGDWRSLFDAAACGSFFVTDESGTAVVEGRIVLLRHPDGGWQTPPASVHQRLAGVGSSLARFGRRERYLEIVLKPGDRVSVLGRATMKVDPAGRSSFRDPPMLHHISGSANELVIVAHDILMLS